MKKTFIVALGLSSLLYSCADNTQPGNGPGADSSAGRVSVTDSLQNANDTAMLTAPAFSIIIDTSDKKLRVVKGADTLKTYPISVGTAKYPTPVGGFRIYQIDFNPNWTPPEGDWAKNKKAEKPGSRKNPMGKARIVYQMPYTIHGTKDINSLGEAESHGSVRMANDQVLELARLIMQETGTIKPETWFQEVLADSTKMISVELKRAVSLTNRE